MDVIAYSFIPTNSSILDLLHVNIIRSQLQETSRRFNQQLGCRLVAATSLNHHILV